MKSRYLVWTGHILGLVLVVFGLWWLAGHIGGMPDYRLVVALAAMTGLVLNHLRWRSLGKEVDNPDMFEKINLLIVSNYLILLLVLMLADFHR